MPLETATYINQLDAANPLGSDPIASGDDHLRLVKATIKATFPNVTGAVTKTHTQLNNTLDKTGDTMTGPLVLSGDATASLNPVSKQQFDAAIASVRQALYPVGSVYINATNGTNPATLLGFGTWTAFGAGRVPVGLDATNTLFDTAEETGGSYDAVVVTHSHSVSGTTNVAGNHNHSTQWVNYTGGGGSGLTDPVNPTTGDYFIPTTFAGDHSHTVTGTAATTGSSGTNANLQPYITVYMWKRTA